MSPIYGLQYKYRLGSTRWHHLYVNNTTTTTDLLILLTISTTWLHFITVFYFDANKYYIKCLPYSMNYSTVHQSVYNVFTHYKLLLKFSARVMEW